MTDFAARALPVKQAHTASSAAGNGSSAKPLVPASEQAEDPTKAAKERAGQTNRLETVAASLNPQVSLRLTVHEESKRVMIQVVDQQKNEVIAEFPPHELLDTLATISKVIGLLLDKHA